MYIIVYEKLRYFNEDEWEEPIPKRKEQRLCCALTGARPPDLSMPSELHRRLATTVRSSSILRALYVFVLLRQQKLTEHALTDDRLVHGILLDSRASIFKTTSKRVLLFTKKWQLNKF